MQDLKREELTIEQYLKGCHCSEIYFQAGGCTLIMTEEGSKLIRPDTTEMLLGNDLKIVRFSRVFDDKLIEVRIKSDVYGGIFYLMEPTGTFVHEE